MNAGIQTEPGSCSIFHVASCIFHLNAKYNMQNAQCKMLVEYTGVEPVTSALRTQRSGHLS